MDTSPLRGIRVLEVGGLGAGPYGVMLLADLGADVIRVDRPPSRQDDPVMASQVGLLRNRRSVAIDLKREGGVQLLLRLVGGADVLVEAFRPGVAERLGFGPDICLARRPELIYARMTGWGQEGPLKNAAGHDINYAALSGALHPIGPVDGPPVPPLNYLADFGGGGTFLAMGVLAALWAREQDVSGRGQVVDVAMIDGTASLSTFLHGMLNSGAWSGERGNHVNDGSRPYYRTYETADGGFLAVGCLEPRFYEEFITRLKLDPASWPQDKPELWPEQRCQLASIFRSKDRAYFEDLFAGSDACVTPVLSPTEAPYHPQMTDRGVFRRGPMGMEPAISPRLARHQPGDRKPPPRPGQHSDEILAELGLRGSRVAALKDSGVVH